MNKNNFNFENLEVKKITKEIVEKAKKNNLVKPVSQAFKDISVSTEIHKGKKEYFSN